MEKSNERNYPHLQRDSTEVKPKDDSPAKPSKACTILEDPNERRQYYFSQKQTRAGNHGFDPGDLFGNFINIFG
jgi:hypothetical protein